MKAQRLIHTTRGQRWVAECADELSGHGKCMNNRQAMDTHGSQACTRFRHHQVIPSQYRNDGSWVRGKRGYGLAVRRREKPILEFPLKLFWGKCSAGIDIPPKRWKDELELLGACHKR